jgi:hypothetical protein
MDCGVGNYHRFGWATDFEAYIFLQLCTHVDCQAGAFVRLNPVAAISIS